MSMIDFSFPPQVWSCQVCGRRRQWGHGAPVTPEPNPETGQVMAEDVPEREPLLTCGGCGRMTRHEYVGYGQAKMFERSAA